MTQSPPERLGQACLEHLHFEESELRALCDTLDELHRAVVAGDMKLVESITSHRNGFSDYRERTDRARDSFCRKAAVALAVPAAKVNLEGIAGALPEPWAGQVRDGAKRIAHLAEDVRARTRRTSMLLMRCRSMTRQILADIGGIGNKVIRYGPSGVHLDEGRPELRLVRGTL